MGLYIGRCFTNYSTNVNPPNPSPSRWTLIEKKEYNNSHVLKVRYHNCTNYEGIKIMVYKGKYTERPVLDPHFSNMGYSPIARFEPTDEGWLNANALAKSYD